MLRAHIALKQDFLYNKPKSAGKQEDPVSRKTTLVAVLLVLLWAVQGATKSGGDAVANRSAVVYPPQTKETLREGDIKPGYAVDLPSPAYPYIAWRCRVQGIVKVKIRISEQGTVPMAQAISGPNLLQQVAEKTAKRSRFSPTLVKGRPMATWGQITYNFVIR